MTDDALEEPATSTQDAVPVEEAEVTAVAAPADQPDQPVEASDADTGDDAARSARNGRAWTFGVARAVAVLVAAGVGYQLLVPQTHVERTRLAQLVTPTTGLKAFPGKPTSETEQPASQVGLNAVTAAAQHAPHQTGVYSATWEPSSTQAAAVYAFLLPNAHQAATTVGQITSQQLSADAFSSNGLSRQSTFTVPDIPGSTGSLYKSSAGQSGAATQLALVAFQEGRTVGVTEVAQASGAQAGASALARAQSAHLRSLQGHFTLSVVTRSVGVTIAWAAGAVVLAALVGFGPLAWRSLARRRRARIQEELDHQVRVGSQVIVKRRV